MLAEAFRGVGRKDWLGWPCRLSAIAIGEAGARNWPLGSARRPSRACDCRRIDLRKAVALLDVRAIDRACHAVMRPGRIGTRTLRSAVGNSRERPSCFEWSMNGRSGRSRSLTAR